MKSRQVYLACKEEEEVKEPKLNQNSMLLLMKEETLMKTFENESPSKFKICFIAQMDGNHFCCYFAINMKTWKECSVLKKQSQSAVNFRWTKHIRQLKSKLIQEEIFKNLQEDFAEFRFIMVQLKVSKFKIKWIKMLKTPLFWRKYLETLLPIIKKTWYESMMMMKWKS